MSLRSMCLAVAAVSLVSVSTSTASAQCGGAGYGMGCCDIGNLYRVMADRVPYFAAFPPVYYSAPVPRSYGHSPFAYLPSHETPEVEAMGPVAIVNPFFRSSTEDSATTPTPPADKLTAAPAPAATPLVISNPFYRPTPALHGPVLQAASLQR